MPIEIIEEEAFNQGTQIKVIGVGGGGGNAVAHMIASGGARRGVHLRQHRRAGPEPQRCAQHASSSAPPAWALAASPIKRVKPPKWPLTTFAPPLRAPTCCSSPPAWAAAPAPVRRR